MSVAVLGGIVNSSNGGKSFRVVLPSSDSARKYKEMFGIILESDDFMVKKEHCVYDRRD